MPSSDQILTQNDHLRSFKVNRFDVNEEPVRGYIVQYNNCGHEYEGFEDIASERSENRHLRRPHTHLTPPLQQTPTHYGIVSGWGNLGNITRTDNQHQCMYIPDTM